MSADELYDAGPTPEYDTPAATKGRFVIPVARGSHVDVTELLKSECRKARLAGLKEAIDILTLDGWTQPQRRILELIDHERELGQ